MQVEWMFSEPATLELTHNWGTESDDTTFHSGNEDPKGYGHIGFAGGSLLLFVMLLNKEETTALLYPYARAVPNTCTGLLRSAGRV